MWASNCHGRTRPLVGLAALLLSLAGGLGAHASEADCKALAGRAVAASFSQLPTSGGVYTSAEFVSAKADAPAYCKVLGRLDPVDPLSWPILFQVNLPEAWNGKAAQFGGGGTNGTVVQATGAFRDDPPGVPGALAQGYLTFGADGGHPQLRPDAQIFALNTEAVVNQAYASYKKSRDLAVHLASAYYGREPRRMYFLGGSEGGRESMLAVQRYPADYDGVVAVVPAMNWAGQHLAHYQEWTLQQDGGWVSPAKMAVVQKAVAAACDSADGLADGVISQYRGCEARFKPASLLCPTAEETPTCLSAKQVAFLDGLWSRKAFPFALENGLASYPPSPYGGEAQLGGVIPSVMLPKAPEAGDVGRGLAGPGSVRYFFARDPEFKGPLDPRRYEARIRALSTLFDATSPDLRAFSARGGKFIIKENGSDYVRSPLTTFEWYDAVVALMGQRATDNFIRLYVNPGVNHGGDGVQADGSAVPDTVELLGVLDAWVEKGAAPGPLTVTSFGKAPAAVAPVASRPLCLYPLYPHFKGGDPKKAASFACRPLPKIN